MKQDLERMKIRDIRDIDKLCEWAAKKEGDDFTLANRLANEILEAAPFVYEKLADRLIRRAIFDRIRRIYDQADKSSKVRAVPGVSGEVLNRLTVDERRNLMKEEGKRREGELKEMVEKYNELDSEYQALSKKILSVGALDPRRLRKLHAIDKKMLSISSDAKTLYGYEL